MKNQQGFSLLEVMIVVFIMATLTILSTQSIQQALRSKVRIQSNLDEMSQVRDALRIIESDVNLAFHYRDVEAEIFDAAKKRRTELSRTSGNSGGNRPPGAVASPDPWAADPSNDPLNFKKASRRDPATQFYGTAEEMSFVTLNTGRILEAEKTTDFSEVGYSVRNCQKPGSKVGTSSCLLRRSSNEVDSKVREGGQETILLTDVEEFKLRYFVKGSTEWLTRWDSVQGESLTKGKYPDAVEISLAGSEGEGKEKRKVSMQVIAPVRFSNNDVPQTNTNPSGQQAPPPPSGGSNL